MAINLEKLYGNACVVLRNSCDRFVGVEEGENMYKNVTKDPCKWLKGSYIPDITAALEIWVDAREALMKSKGGTVYSAVKRIVKSVGDKRPAFNGCWTDSEGRQCFCNGYYAVRLKNHVDGFETVPGMDLDPVMKLEGECVMLDLPTPGELKACMAEQENVTQKIYDFGGNLPKVNAAYLRDILIIFPNAVAKSYGANKPILFEDETGDALLLPIHKYEAA